MIKTISIVLIISFCTHFPINLDGPQIFLPGQTRQLNYSSEMVDYDPLVDLMITIQIDYLCNLKKQMSNMTLEIQIENESFLSPEWSIPFYCKEINWSMQYDISDDTPLVNISFTLHDDQYLCDLTGDPSTKKANIQFDVRTGKWIGDDCQKDASGYGRLNGCDDGSYDNEEHDVEMDFTVFLNDYDHDYLPYYVEKTMFHTDPLIDDTGRDDDADMIPIEYEYLWGFNPFSFDEFQDIDIDNDGLNGLEEYLMSSWNADPYRPDIFVEIDQMEPGPNQQGDWLITDECITLLSIPFQKRNMVLHIPSNNHDILPFDEMTNQIEILTFYNRYFLNQSHGHWKRGIFRYGLIIYHHEKAAGKAFIGEGFPINSNIRGINSFLVTKTAADETLMTSDYSEDFIYATYIMHELGHSMGLDILNPPGCDNKFTVHPIFPGWWRYEQYRSVMNYRYVHTILDYSDGTNGRNDFDDWGNLDLTWFEEPISNPYYKPIQDIYRRIIGIK